MGQAKSRGTFEERRLQALVKRKAGAIAEMLHMPAEPLADLYLHNRIVGAFMAKPETEGQKEEQQAG